MPEFILQPLHIIDQTCFSVSFQNACASVSELKNMSFLCSIRIEMYRIQNRARQSIRSFVNRFDDCFCQTGKERNWDGGMEYSFDANIDFVCSLAYIELCLIKGKRPERAFSAMTISLIA